MTKFRSDVNDAELAALSGAADRPPILDVEFEALMYMLRDGPSALSRPDVQRHLTRLDDEQMRQAVGRLTRRSASNKTPWRPNEIQMLMAD
ncbi:MAG: hypothetical protein WCD69_25165 [Xanthobacteraceae bacterium]